MVGVSKLGSGPGRLRTGACKDVWSPGTQFVVRNLEWLVDRNGRVAATKASWDLLSVGGFQMTLDY